MKTNADYPPSPKTRPWLAHDLLQIPRGADLFCPEPCPFWVKHSLEQAPLVVVRRAEPLDGMIPVGVRGSLRNQRFGAYLAPKSILRQIAPEQLAAARGWLGSVRSREVPALGALAVVAATLPKFSLAFGPTGSVGFELASGRATATSTSDLDLLIRAPERISMKVARELLRSMAQGPCRIDVQLETPRGAVSLAEYARGDRPLLLRKSGGPVLVSDPWK